MASTSKVGLSGDDEEELERFDDFTLVSAWERFISKIEAVCRQWLADGPKNLRVSFNKIWNDAPALPAYEQKPILDPFREGEKILHYLETLRPHQLLEQMVCTAFRASADTLRQPNFGGLKLMTTKMEQLYHTIASTLKPLQTNHIYGNSETTEDLRRLCVISERVEKLLTLAVSLHRKFMQAPCMPF